MSSQMQTVLWIAGMGGLLLFAAIAGLVGLMYLLTSPLLSFRRTRSTDAHLHPMNRPWRLRTPKSRSGADARPPWSVAVACAEADRSPIFSADDSASWRLLHRSSRLRQRVVKRGMEP